MGDRHRRKPRGNTPYESLPPRAIGCPETFSRPRREGRIGTWRAGRLRGLARPTSNSRRARRLATFLAEIAAVESWRNRHRLAGCHAANTQLSAVALLSSRSDRRELAAGVARVAEQPNERPRSEACANLWRTRRGEAEISERFCQSSSVARSGRRPARRFGRMASELYMNFANQYRVPAFGV